MTLASLSTVGWSKWLHNAVAVMLLVAVQRVNGSVTAGVHPSSRL